MMNFLHIEDEPADSQLLVRHLRRHDMPADVRRVDSRDALAAALDEAHWDAVLADYNVPGLPFRETLALVSARLPDCPIILVSGSIGEEAAVELLKEGVWDFVLKDNLLRLCPAIERGLRDSLQRKNRRQDEERLRQAATVFESTQDGVMITDLAGRMLAVNKAFTEITGYREDEVLGKKARLNRSRRHDSKFYTALWSVLLSRGQWQGELWNRGKDGREYPAWLTISTVRDDTGQPSHYVGVFSDISALKRSEEQLAHLAHYDPLTELPNRLLLQSRLEQATSRAARYGKRAAVLFIDLDRFKTINSNFGHAAGDQLLVDVAHRLRQRVRDEDFLGRFGADDFLLVLEPIDEPDEAALVARTIVAALEAPFRLAGDSEVYVGASIGISVFPDDGSNATDLQRAADTAMHQAKDAGRNRFCFYTADMNVNAMAQFDLETALRRALERDELLLYFQPKLDLRSGRIVGAEALIRWQKDDGEPLLAGDFIPLAEKSDLIGAIGAWAIDAACLQLRQWRDAGWPDLRLSVNVSGRQFAASDLPSTVGKALARHAIPASRLELEVTESMLMDDPEQTISILTALKRTGVKLSLDDFGTGYSSFAYLSRFPIDTLKIDQSFVRNIVSEPDAAMIAVSIIDLAHRMNLKVVAEGVETPAQLGYLRMRNCDEIQGYVFAGPLSAESFAAVLREGQTLPMTTSSEERELAERRSTSPVSAPSASRHRTILLVDDDRDVLEALSMLLEGEGYRILTAGSGAAGLELLAQEAVDVIVSDQRMPGMSGTEFLTRVKTIHPQTARILVSGFSELESIADAINDGAIYKFLTKPVSAPLLRANIDEAFRHKELADDNRWLRSHLQATSRELAQANGRLRQILSKRDHGRAGTHDTGEQQAGERPSGVNLD